MFPDVKTLKVLFVLLCVLFAKQVTYAQDFEVELSSLAPEQDTTCLGDSLELSIEIRYSGTSILNADTGYFAFTVGDGVHTPAFLKEAAFSWEDTQVPDSGVLLGVHMDTIPLNSQFFEENTDNILNVSFSTSISEQDLDNNAFNDTTYIACVLVDFETELDTLIQDTLCTGDLTIESGIRYNGSESITVDTLYLNYYIGQENDSDNNGNGNDNSDSLEPVYIDTLLNRTFQPNEFIPRSLTYPLNGEGLPTGNTGFVLIWPTTTRNYLDTNPDNDISIDSTDITCELIEVDFETELEPFEEEQDTLCVGEDLLINGGIRYNGSEAITIDTLYLNYYVGQEGSNGNVDDLTPVHIDTLLDRTFQPDEFVPRSLTYSISSGGGLPTGNTGFVLIWPTTTRDYLDTSPENDVSIDSVEVTCELIEVDFETELEPFEEEQDTLCVGEDLLINGGIRYNGSEAITIDTLYLNYYVGQEGSNGNVDDLTPVHIDTLLDRTFQPDEFVPRSLTYSISSGGGLPTGNTGFVLIWPTTTRDYLDTSPENDVSIDSVEVTCELIEVDFETELEPFEEEQDTLCVGEDLLINGGIRYNGSEAITIDTLYLNYYVGQEGSNGNVDDLTPVHIDTLLDRTFQPDEFVPRSLTYPISGGGGLPTGNTGFVLIWPTTTRDYLDTSPENDVSIDSVEVTCELIEVDFETELEPFEEEQDTLCVGEDLLINGGIRYNGSEAITIDTLYLNYYVGQEGSNGNVDDLTPVHIDTLLDRTFQPDEFVPRSLTYAISGGGGIPTGNTGFVLIWPTTTRDYLDVNPSNDVAIDSTAIACELVDFSTSLELSSPTQDTVCIGDTLQIHASIRYHGEEPITIDTFYLEYYLGSDWNGDLNGQVAIVQDTLYNRTFQPEEEIQRIRPFAAVAPIFVQNSTGFVLIWPTTTRSYKDIDPSNDVSVDSLTIACIPSLPLNLISFTGKYGNREVELDWQVSLWNEGNYFDVERSENGFDFELIDKINAIANEQANTYRYTDKNPYLTTTYYRLKMVDISGTVKYSPIIAVKRDGQNTLSINHIHVDDNELNLTYSSTNHTPLTMSLYDVMGRLMHREVITNVQSGFNQWKIDVTGINSGVYVLSLQSENELISRMLKR